MGSTATSQLHRLQHVAVNARYLSRALLTKPRFVARMARSFALAALRPDRPPVRLVDVALTYDCNMRCTHCSATEMKQPERPKLDLHAYRTVADRLARAGALVINITGGEPFVRADLFDIIRTFDPRRFLVAVVTNGLAVTESKVKELARLGVNSIHVSIDGADPAAHDGFRKTPGAFEKALRVLEWGKRYGLGLGINYSLTHENIDSDDRAQVEALSQRLGTMLNYNLAVPIGFWKGMTDNLLQPGDRQKLQALLDRNPSSKTDFETNYFRQGCGAIKEKFYITAYGDVMPCPFIQVAFGNILVDSVETIRDRALAYGYFQEYVPHCLAAEDKDFIANTKCYGEGAEPNLPVWHEVAFRDMNSARSGRISSQQGSDLQKNSKRNQ